jgi:hypothetical protein
LVAVTVSAVATGLFKGLLLQARLVNTNTPVGQFQGLPDGLKPLTCGTANNSVTHSSSDDKDTVVVQWVVPSDFTADVEFVATIVHSFDVFWTQVKSPVLSAVPNPCVPNPCLNDHTCYSTDGRSFFCGCLAPYSGPLCEGKTSPSIETHLIMDLSHFKSLHC